MFRVFFVGDPAKGRKNGLFSDGLHALRRLRGGTSKRFLQGFFKKNKKI